MRELSGGNVASYSLRPSTLEWAILKMCLKVLFTKMTYASGPTLKQPYLSLALLLPAVSVEDLDVAAKNRYLS